MFSRSQLIVTLAVTLTLPSVARSQATTPGSPRLRVTTEDRRALAEYQGQLQSLLAAHEAPPAAPTATAPGARAGTAATSTCKLFQADAPRSTATDCLACHALHSTHPVDLDYASAAATPRAQLRTAAEVVRRGVFLPDGQLRCVTCHDAGSRWAHRLAIPPSAGVRPAVNLRDPSTYERPIPLTDGRALPDGTAVSTKPLCTSCHTTGD